MSEKIIQLNEVAIKKELGDLVLQSVEDTLNTLLDEEAEWLEPSRIQNQYSCRFVPGFVTWNPRSGERSFT